MTNSLGSLSVTQLKQAITIKEQIEALESELASVLGGAAPAAVSAPSRAGRKKRRMSAAARARISAAQRARWANQKKATAAAPAAVPKKRKVTAAGRKRLSALAKARWAKVRAAGKASLKAG